MPASDSEQQQYLIDELEKILAMAKRHKFPVSLVKIKIDNQQEMQRNNNQQIMEEVTQCLTILISSTSRHEDTIIRFSNLAFAILLPFCSAQSAVEKSERMRKDICKLTPKQIEITASFGVAGISEESNVDPENMIASANNALEQAKSEGGNRVILQSERVTLPA